MSAKFNLKALMELVKNGQFVGIDQITVPTIRKTMDVVDENGKKSRVPNPHFGHVKKMVTGSRVFVGASYEKMVQRRLEAEGRDAEEAKNFEAGALPWGEYVEGGFPVITHNGKFYLRVIFENAGTTQYLLDGAPIAKEEIIGLSEPKTSDNAQGGLSEENQVVIRTIGFDSLMKVRAAGQCLVGPFSWS